MDNLNFKITALYGQALSSLNSVNVKFSELNRTVSKGNSNFTKHQAVIAGTRKRYFDLNTDANRANNTLTKVNRNLKSFTTMLPMGMISNVALGMALSKSIQGAMDMIETTNLFSVAMGDLAIETGQALEKISEVSGMDLTNLKNAVGTYNLLARSMGMSSTNAQTLSVNTYKLSMDLASLTNVPINQVMSDMRAGLVGQSETVYKYGLDVTEASIKTEALALGIEKSVRNMSQGEKMFLRHIVMMKQSAIAHGDMARTIETPANQLRILSQRFATLSRNIGTLFIPTLSRILPWLNAIVTVLNRLIERLALLIGYEPPETMNVETPFTGIEDSADDATDSVNKLKNAIKALSGFDELNIFSETATSGGLGSIEEGFDIDLANTYAYDSLLDGLKQKSDEIADRIEPAMEKIFNWAILIGKVFLGWKVISPLLTVLSAVVPAGSLVGSMLALGKVLPALTFAGLAVRWQELAKESEPFKKGLERIGEIFDILKESFDTGLTNIRESFMKLLPPDTVKEIDEFTAKFREWIELIDIDFADVILTVGGFASLFTPLAPLGVAVLMFEAITLSLKAMGIMSEESWKDMKETLDTTLGQHIRNDLEQFQILLEDIRYFISGDFKRDIINSFESIGKKSEEIFTMLPEPIINAFNTVIDALNKLIGNLNKLKIDVPPEWTDFLGMPNLSFGFNINPIPRIGEGFGGSATGSMIGAKRVVGGIGFTPQQSGSANDYNYNGTSIQEAKLNDILSALTTGNASPQIIENILKLDGNTVYKNQQEIQRSRGVTIGGGGGVFSR